MTRRPGRQSRHSHAADHWRVAAGAGHWAWAAVAGGCRLCRAAMCLTGLAAMCLTGLSWRLGDGEHGANRQAGAHPGGWAVRAQGQRYGGLCPGPSPLRGWAASPRACPTHRCPEHAPTRRTGANTRSRTRTRTAAAKTTGRPVRLFDASNGRLFDAWLCLLIARLRRQSPMPRPRRHAPMVCRMAVAALPPWSPGHVSLLNVKLF